MKNITYLFGAGASANALPVVNQIPDKIKELIILLKSNEYRLSDKDYFENDNGRERIKSSKSTLGYQEEIIEELEWLYDKEKNHSSVDTFAKKLYIQEDFDDLRRLKIILSVFFIFLQGLKKPDLRYDSFYASLIDRIHDFPKNIKILSWNYDYQFELSYSYFSRQSNHGSINHVNGFLNIHQKNSSHDRDSCANKFGIYKLNGTCGTNLKFDRSGHFNSPIKEFDSRFIYRVTEYYFKLKFKREEELSLSYAWEREFIGKDKSVIVNSVKAIENTDILIIIGYTFPFFNRKIDGEILNSMKKLEKVYIQDLYTNGPMERFQALREDFPREKIILKENVDQFFIPNEL